MGERWETSCRGMSTPHGPPEPIDPAGGRPDERNCRPAGVRSQGPV